VVVWQWKWWNCGIIVEYSVEKVESGGGGGGRGGGGSPKLRKTLKARVGERYGVTESRSHGGVLPLPYSVLYSVGRYKYLEVAQTSRRHQ
jgi:hypothetical protein